MCNFLSAIVMKNGDIITAPEYTNSHEDLIRAFSIKDTESNSLHQSFARVEFSPPKDGKNVGNFDTWMLTVDEQNVPDWLDRGALRSKLIDLVRPHIIDGERDFLFGGWYIVEGKGNIKVGQRVNLIAMFDSSQVGEMRGSSQVGEMLGSSPVGKMWDSSQVGELWDSSQVKKDERIKKDK